MQMARVRVGYFSPTRNGMKFGKAVGTGISGHLKVKMIREDWETKADREKVKPFTADEFAVIAFPVYAGRLPNLMLPFVKSLRGDNTPAVALVSYGNRNFDDALSELTGLLNEQGFVVGGAAAFPAEHAFSRTLGAGRPEPSDLSQARAFGIQIAHKFLQSGADAMSDAWRDCAVKGNWPPGPYYVPRDKEGDPIDIRKVKPGLRDHCTHCGYCAEICPMGAIDHNDVANVPGICIKCNACVKRCPVNARYFDDPGYLFHVRDLEETYADRKEAVFFGL